MNTRPWALITPTLHFADSKTTLQAILGGGLFVILVVSGLLVLVVLRLGHARRLAENQSDPDDPTTGSI